MKYYTRYNTVLDYFVLEYLLLVLTTVDFCSSLFDFSIAIVLDLVYFYDTYSSINPCLDPVRLTADLETLITVTRDNNGQPLGTCQR